MRAVIRPNHISVCLQGFQNLEGLYKLTQAKLLNLNQVTVPSLDVEKSIEFYEKLGLRLIVKALPHYARFECVAGDSTFSMHQVEKMPIGEGVYVYFETPDLDNQVDRLRKEGFIFDQLPIDQSWLWREARFKDPDGNRIILYYAGANRKNPPWRIDSP